MILRVLVLVILILILVTLVYSRQCEYNEIFDSIEIAYPNTNDSIVNATDIIMRYVIKDSQLFYNNENELMLCISTRKNSSMKTVCGLSLTTTHSLNLYYNGYQDIIASVYYKSNTATYLCTSSVTVNNENRPSCITNTKLNTVFDIIRAPTMEHRERYYSSYSVIESNMAIEIFMPIHYTNTIDALTVGGISLSEIQMLSIKSLVNSIEDVLSIKNIKININFLLHNFDPLNSNDEKNINDIIKWLLTLTKTKLLFNLYLCPSNTNDRDCSMWTIYENMGTFNDDSIILVLDSDDKIVKRTFIQSIDNLFRNNNPCYALPSFFKSSEVGVPPLYYVDTEVKNHYIRWGYVPDQFQMLLSSSMSNLTAAFRLNTFSYFINKELSITNLKSHLINVYNSYDDISIVHD